LKPPTGSSENVSTPKETSKTSGLYFLIWVIANLFPRAIAHHNWYKNKFKDYPKNRKAIIPKLI